MLFSFVSFHLMSCLKWLWLVDSASPQKNKVILHCLNNSVSIDLNSGLLGTKKDALIFIAWLFVDWSHNHNDVSLRIQKLLVREGNINIRLSWQMDPAIFLVNINFIKHWRCQQSGDPEDKLRWRNVVLTGEWVGFKWILNALEIVCICYCITWKPDCVVYN